MLPYCPTTLVLRYAAVVGQATVAAPVDVIP